MNNKESIGHCREQIDTINRALLALLNRRVEVANRIGALKKAKDLPLSDLSREREILRRVLKENQGPLDRTAIKKIFGAIISETKRLERKALRGKTHPPS